MYADGTNVLAGTEFRVLASKTTDWYLPSESRASANWVERWTKLRIRFEAIVDQCRPAEAILIQTRIPAFARDSIGALAMTPGFNMFQSGGGLQQEPTDLYGTDGRPLSGAFAIKGAQGTPLLNEGGSPRALRFGLFRQHFLAAPSFDEESRPVPNPRLSELARDATGLLYVLPEEVAITVWRNWLPGFSRGRNSTEHLWYDAVFELSWQGQPGGSLYSKRYAWIGNSSVEVVGSGLFPRFPDLGSFPLLDSIPAESGHPMAYRSKLSDMARASVAAIDEIIERGNMASSKSGKRFAVALSFPGERRRFVEQVAGLLASRVGRGRVLYDKYHEAEFAKPNLDAHLQHLYHDASDLIVVFLCSEYNEKEWCGLEWRAIRDLIKKEEDSRIMLLRFDNTAIPGLFSTDGYAWIGNRSPQAIADLILQRMQVGANVSQSKKPADSEKGLPAKPVIDNSVSDYLAQAQQLNSLPRLVVDRPGGSGSSNGFEYHFTIKNIGSGAAEQISAEIIGNETVRKSDRLRDMPAESQQEWKPGFPLRYPFANMKSLLVRFGYSNILGSAFVSEFRIELEPKGDFAKGIVSVYFGPPRN